MTAPIRVIHLINSLNMGGAEKRLVEIVENLPTSRFQCTVVCLSFAGAYESRIRKAGAEVEVLGYRGLWRNGQWAVRNLFQPLRAMRRFQATLDRHQPDVVHTWLPICNFIGGRALCRWRYRKMAYISSRVFTSEYRDLNPLIPLAELFAARRTDLIYCNSIAVRDDTISSEPGIDPSTIRLIRNGVDTTKYRSADDKIAIRRELGLPEEEKIILSVGALRAHKGHEVLLDAVKELLPAHTKLHVFFIGADQGEGPSLLKKSEELGIAEQVEFVGQRMDIPSWMQAADVLVLPSFQEGLPNVLLEALASGIPCVATNLPGCDEALGGGEFGRLVPPNNATALAEAMDEVLMNAPTEKWRTEARKLVEDNFSFQRMLASFADLYTEASQLR